MVADYFKRVTIGELMNMPNRYIHAMWKPSYEQVLYDKMHPKEAEQRQMGEALSNLM